MDEQMNVKNAFVKGLKDIMPQEKKKLSIL